MISVNAIGETCPIPVVKARNAIKELNGPGTVEVLVDNEIAVQNLTKMANQKGYGIRSEKTEDGNYRAVFTIGEPQEAEEGAADEPVACVPDARKDMVVVISSGSMGHGNEELGKILIKGFIYALTQQEHLPKTMLFYNGGAAITCQDSPALEDLKALEAQGVEILTCGTCLDYYGLKEKLAVGSVTNMYEIVEKMTTAGLIVKP